MRRLYLCRRTRQTALFRVTVHQGRTKRSNHTDLHADLQQRIPPPQDGYGKRPGVDPVLDYYDYDRCCICQPEEVGLLFR